LRAKWRAADCGIALYARARSENVGGFVVLEARSELEVLDQ